MAVRRALAITIVVRSSAGGIGWAHKVTIDVRNKITVVVGVLQRHVGFFLGESLACRATIGPLLAITFRTDVAYIIGVGRLVVRSLMHKCLDPFQLGNLPKIWANVYNEFTLWAL